MATTIKGKWIFNRELNYGDIPYGTTLYSGTVLFTTGRGYTWYSMAVTRSTGKYPMLCYVTWDSIETDVYTTDNQWILGNNSLSTEDNSNYFADYSQGNRFVDFGYVGKAMDDDFYDWFIHNATNVELYAIKPDTLTALANAIRTKNSATSKYTPSEMAEAIKAMEAGGIIPTGTLSITTNGTYDVTNYASANVDIDIDAPITEALNVTANGTYTPNAGVDGFNTVTVNVPEPVVKPITIIANGTYNAPDGVDGYSSIVVNVPSTGGDGYWDEDTVKAFANRTATSLSLPDGLTIISDYTFYNYASLESMTLPNSIARIGKYAFYNCKGLTLTSLPNNLTNIGNQAFYNCAGLALTSLPYGLSSIGTYAFSGCTDLALTSLPEGIAVVDSKVFYNCTGLTSMTLPSSITNVANNAFEKCTGLTTVTFKAKPVAIGSTAFNSCTNLTTINVPWAEGTIANAPWGATNATINYNYTG